VKLIIALFIILLCLTVGAGIYFYYRDNILAAEKKLKLILGTNVSMFIMLMIAAALLIFGDKAYAVETQTVVNSSNAGSAGLGYLAAALSTGLATIGAGYAVGSVGSSALGAVSEDPKILGKTLIFVGLAEGIAIYGLIVSILILGRL